MFDQLSYFLFPGEFPDPIWEGQYRDAYCCWRRVWLETFRELDGSDRIYSDDFTRQSEIGAIFLQERCVAMGLLHRVDFRSLTAREDSYFKVWSDEALNRLTEDGPKIWVASHLTVHPDFRGDLGSGIALKNLIVGLVVKSLLSSDADAMTGTMRCNRGAHKSAYLYGATPIQRGIIHHGVEVDLVAFYRRRLSEPGALATDLSVERLWKNRTDVRARSTHPSNLETKKGEAS